MAKRYDSRTFKCKVNGVDIEFYAYTTDTRNGFCHTIVCESHNTTDTKVSYLNRTWESFRYETALRSAIKKLPKELREGAEAILINHEAEEAYNKAEAMVTAFKEMHDKLSDADKKRLAESGIEMRSEGDARAVMGLMAMMSLMSK